MASTSVYSVASSIVSLSLASPRAEPFSRNPVALSLRDMFSGAPPSSFGCLAAKPVGPQLSSRKQRLLCRAAEYVFPDPIPEFADHETDKFKACLLERLSKKDIFGDSLKEIVGICTEIMSNFLHTEYGGPGTLLVVPFIDMADTINERGLPGGPQAARAAVVWAQKHVDLDWKEWTAANKKV